VSLVGKNIDAHCLKCKLVLAHVVLYEVRGVVSKVKCRTCGAEHKYRGVKPPIKKGGPTVRTLKENRSITAAARNISSQAPMQWAVKHDHINSQTSVKDYRMQGRYQANDVIRHPLFGVGFVERIVSDKRMDVLFQDAIKPMVMNIPS
jgi:RNase P subunit RPR2